MAKRTVEELKLQRIIKDHIERVLRATHYNQSQAAKMLGLPLSTLRSKMKKLGIETKRTRELSVISHQSSVISPS
jgi:DNA-binding protein Fis